MATSESQGNVTEEVKSGNFGFQFKIHRQAYRLGRYGGEFYLRDYSRRDVYLIKVFKQGESERARKEMAILNKLQNCPNSSKILATITGNEKIPLNGIVTDFVAFVKWGDYSKTMTSADIQHYTYQLFIALDACHSQNIIHGSVNPSNLRIDNNNKVLKLTEWENAEEHEDGNFYRTNFNSLYFQSPELILNFKKYDYSIDLWAAGCIIAGSIFKMPYVFDGEAKNEQMQKIARVLGKWKLLSYAEEYKIIVSKRLRSKIRRCRAKGFEIFKTKNCEQTATEEAIDLVKKLLIYDHTKRLKAKDALQHHYFSEFHKKTYLNSKNKDQEHNIQNNSPQVNENSLYSNKDAYLKFVIHGEIGSGVSGKVYRVKDPENYYDYAVKSFERAALSNLWEEVKILKHLEGCPNINRYLGYIVSETMSIQCLVFEFVSTQLWGQIFDKLSVEDIGIYFYQMLLALQGCHSRGIMHRDIKPSNMLIDHFRRKVYLTDWGHATFYREGVSYDTHVGTRKYCSPELLLRYQKHDYAVDMWSIGCILASAVFRVRYIFDGEDREDQMLRIVKMLGSNNLLHYCKKYAISAPCLSNWGQFLGYHRIDWRKLITGENKAVATDEAIDLLDKLIVFDHKKRLTSSEALKHPFLNKFRHSFA
ncbi:unnamed protein product [Hymenolepis diminuta]|uniref:non-specific serine/threonine protein kinase n=1 Tax=Hymenolepis diminuta TaxID=6216 RepID=A0A564YP27_HYMDI|nr:unnamed protein product [Hymenolepis diminuta]